MTVCVAAELKTSLEGIQDNNGYLDFPLSTLELCMMYSITGPKIK